MKKSLLFKIVVIVFAFVGLISTADAQVTTSSMNGRVADSRGALPGASIKAIHTPSGTTYTAASNNDGRFSIGNMRVGGPYTIEVTYVGFQPKKIEGVYLKLGEGYVVDARLDDSGTSLKEVSVQGVKTNKLNQQKTGASTNISSRDLVTLPSISRSINDFTRLTPQSNGNSFGGRDAKYNNIQVDGANLNNNFGLSNDPLPGGGSQPISLDSYDQISVSIAPYDVRQAGFTGASINAVTKSGTNDFHGTAYGFYKNRAFVGKNVRDKDISSLIKPGQTKIYGLSLGGPIIKNKLFFFVNAEKEINPKAGVAFTATDGGTVGTSSTTTAQLKQVSDYLKTKGYETGSYTDYPAFGIENHKILAKIDWNINNANKLTLKYSDFVGTEDQLLNATSVPNGGGFKLTPTGSALSRLPNERFSAKSMGYANSNYSFKNITRTGTLELNSRITNNLSNQVLLAVTKNKATRDYPGALFPTIDIFEGGNNVISAGMDPYTYNNDVVNDVYSFTNNLSYSAGVHNLTAGLTYEYQKTGNMYMPASNSYYAYASINDFVTEKSPIYYAYTYSLVPGKKSVYSAELKLGQAGAYIQDEVNVSDNAKFTFGLRADLPIYHENPLNNPATSALSFYDADRTTLKHYTTDHWNKQRVLLSPRFGFRITDDSKTTVLRGGLGIFTGKIPFVYLTNIPTNTGMYQFGGAVNNGTTAGQTTLNGIKFSSDVDAYASLFPSTAGTTPSTNVVFLDDNFKFPKVFRVNLGLDKSLGNGWTATFDGLFTKDVNSVVMRNANMPNPNGIVTEGGLTRERIVGNNKLNSNIGTAIVLENSIKGYSTSLTAQLSKAYSGGFSGSIAYTYSLAKDLTANPGSQASSIWNLNPNVGVSNSREMYNSAFAVPHRIVANVSYRAEYLRNLATTIGVFYEGTNQGLYSYVVNGDINGDGNNAADLMYIPRAGETHFTNITGAGNVVLFTAAQQEAALQQFIENTPYLRKNRGSFATRNGALLPWYNKVDVKLTQDIFVRTGSKDGKQTLQLTADVLNVANLLNKKWGALTRYVINNPLKLSSVNAQNQPIYTLATNVDNQLITSPFAYTESTLSTYSIQVGVRYIF
jgi:hypothetical protein